MKRLLSPALLAFALVASACPKPADTPTPEAQDAGVFLDASEALDAAEPIPTGPVAVQILAFNDFHGALQAVSGSEGSIGNTPAGGAAYLAAHLKRLESENPNTLIVTAGDVVGGSPLLSAMFHDEPTIWAMDLMGVDLSAVGNHELDEGWRELVRLQKGGCRVGPDAGCDGGGFAGARFEYLTSNVQFSAAEPLFPRYRIENLGGAKVAFVGATLAKTPEYVTPSGVEGLTFLPEADAVNALVPELKAAGASAIVLLLHEGAFVTSALNPCASLDGDLLPILQALDPAVDVVVSGHTHDAYDCELGGRLVTSAASSGRLLTQIKMVVDPVQRRVLSKEAANLIVTRDVARDPVVQALIEQYEALAAAESQRVVGHLVDPMISAEITSAGESPLGNAIADSQLEATGAQIAFMNSGGIRANLVGRAPDNAVTFEDVFATQPFGDTLVTMTLTGQQLHDALEQQFAEGWANILQVSRGFEFTWGTFADHVRPADIKLNGAPIDLATSYRVTVNSYLAEGANGFAAFKAGTNRQVTGGDVQAMVDYLGAHDPLPTPATGRIVGP